MNRLWRTQELHHEGPNEGLLLQGLGKAFGLYTPWFAVYVTYVLDYDRAAAELLKHCEEDKVPCH